ncbi:MAG: tRNA (adenosine(37)-N6)-threonylcarbamoyltransferase complex dimerization subunit type 1 TsaB [Acidimicrobiia bacterium]|jgi:tRNA threonylcarbamoyladenosine biosynthesis protein TsaB|nr:MAG: tRNA (adenosine(37)-N6)-threonylcarbamoyltransferase complex dimerization subunit type 1 TsaB [Acidimicrobiia bacterium]
MKLVAIESSTPASSVALMDGTDVVGSASRIDRRGHSAFLTAALDFCLDQADWSPADLDGVAVGIGPGLYTGLRVGIATAQGLAATLGIPIVPVTSLDALAHRSKTGRRHIWAIVDLRRGEFAVASYRPVPGGVVRDTMPEVVTPQGLRAMLLSDADDVLLVGDVPALGDGFLTGLHRARVGRPRFPSAVAVAGLGGPRIAHDDVPHPDEVRPLYLRDPDVTVSSALLEHKSPWEDA